MAGVVLETLSWKKLIILGISLLLLLIAFFLIGGLVAPNPSNFVYVTGTTCIDDSGSRNSSEWFIPRGGVEKCTQVDTFEDPYIRDHHVRSGQVVFSFWLPHLREGKQLDFSPWQQYMIAVLQVDISYNEDIPLAEDAILTLDARIGYREKTDGKNDWKELARSLEERKLNCFLPKKVEKYQYNCEALAFFELGSLHHDYYLVNIRIPTDPVVLDRREGMNQAIGKLEDLHLVAIHQNGGFTKVWISIKSVMFPLIIAVMIWFWRRIQQLTRQPNLLERTLLALGIAMSVLNCPLEYFSLAFDMPYMLLLTDIRQGYFYAMLLSFWIIFTGEHIMDTTERNRLVVYWKHLLAVIIGCFCLLLFELSERGVQLVNPFFSIWVTDLGARLALSFIIIAAISAAGYFFFLCYMIFLVFRNISAKRTALPSMTSGRRLYYLGLIYRFKFLMLVTLVCSALTVVFFILSQLSEGQWQWMEQSPALHYTSAFFTGVYGMWNVYVIGLLSLYAPSHKQFAPTSVSDENSREEEVQLTYLPSNSEGSAIQAFASKAAMD
ncbi:protein wntless homolog B-like [Mya arenaria]|uniref:protein wntless homolog B-like n=1 Tax=Mya arenaria TaxID=6604 RepID=UPI0022DF322E|nr:protein wntless homolog B-like [Mya arenaria]